MLSLLDYGGKSILDTKQISQFPVRVTKSSTYSKSDLGCSLYDNMPTSVCNVMFLFEYPVFPIIPSPV